jgi:hypothetical protein
VADNRTEVKYMMFYVLVTLLFLPVYLAVRWPYCKLPIGPDVGYYVSNNTIASGRLSYCKGWNARYALCSKFIPEVFLSFFYTRFGPQGYSRAWRLGYSFYNYLTAIFIGWLAHLCTGGTMAAYPSALIFYGLVSSEVDYGIYYESAEQFEILFQAAGTAFIIAGMVQENASYILIGTGLWFLDAFFVKITALAAALPLVAGVVFITPSLLFSIAVEFVIISVAYIGLFLQCNRNPLEVIKSELGHQSFYSKKGMSNANEDKHGLTGWKTRIVEKIGQMVSIVAASPFIPLLAFAGSVWSPSHLNHTCLLFLSLYVFGVVIKLGVSFLPIWWYTIPVLPLFGVYASFGALQLLDGGWYGAAMLCLMLAGWGYANVVRIRRKDAENLNRYAWKTHPGMGQAHFELQTIAPELDTIINDGAESLFVFGTPSPYAMIGNAYNVNFLSAVYYMDGINPKWEEELHYRMFEAPPKYVLDMFDSFGSAAIAENLGLRYAIVKSWQGKHYRYDLYELKEQADLGRPNFEFKSLIR